MRTWGEKKKEENISCFVCSSTWGMAWPNDCKGRGAIAEDILQRGEAVKENNRVERRKHTHVLLYISTWQMIWTNEYNGRGMIERLKDRLRWKQDGEIGGRQKALKEKIHYAIVNLMDEVNEWPEG